MTTRTIIRTPRRKKAWFNYHSIVDLSSGTPSIVKLFDQAQTDLGVSNTPGITVMRAVGNLALTAWTAGATTAAYEGVKIGLAWLDRLTANAGAGDGNIPRPLQIGLRDTRWYQQWELGGLEYTAPVVLGSPLLPVEDSMIKGIDCTNQQKQQTADQEFCMVIHHGGTFETDTTRLSVNLDFLVALP